MQSDTSILISSMNVYLSTNIIFCTVLLVCEIIKEISETLNELLLLLSGPRHLKEKEQRR